MPLGLSEKFLRTSSVSLFSLTLPVPKVSMRTETGSGTPVSYTHLEPEFTWEATDKATALAEQAGVATAAK